MINRDFRPDFFAIAGIERDQATVERANEYLTAPNRHTAIDHVATGLMRRFARNFRIIGPQQIAGLAVKGGDFRPRGGCVDHAIDDDWRGFMAAVGIEFVAPRKAELGDSG